MCLVFVHSHNHKEFAVCCWVLVTSSRPADANGNLHLGGRHIEAATGTWETCCSAWSGENPSCREGWTGKVSIIPKEVANGIFEEIFLFSSSNNYGNKHKLQLYIAFISYLYGSVCMPIVMALLVLRLCLSNSSMWIRTKASICILYPVIGKVEPWDQNDGDLYGSISTKREDLYDVTDHGLKWSKDFHFFVDLFGRTACINLGAKAREKSFSCLNIEASWSIGFWSSLIFFTLCR